jgi:hypothetical protein
LAAKLWRLAKGYALKRHRAKPSETTHSLGPSAHTLPHHSCT